MGTPVKSISMINQVNKEHPLDVSDFITFWLLSQVWKPKKTAAAARLSPKPQNTED